MDNNFNGWGQYHGTPQLKGAYGPPLPKKVIPAINSTGKDLNHDLNDTASPEKSYNNNEEGEENIMSEDSERNRRWELDVSLCQRRGEEIESAQKTWHCTII